MKQIDSDTPYMVLEFDRRRLGIPEGANRDAVIAMAGLAAKRRLDLLNTPAAPEDSTDPNNDNVIDLTRRRQAYAASSIGDVAL